MDRVVILPGNNILLFRVVIPIILRIYRTARHIVLRVCIVRICRFFIFQRDWCCNWRVLMDFKNSG